MATSSINLIVTSISRRVMVLTAVMVLVVGCTSDGDGTSDGSDSAKSAMDTECLNAIQGPGELEVSDSVFTVVDRRSDGDAFTVMFAVELTNTSKTETAMVAPFKVRLLGEDGQAASAASKDGEPEQYGHVEYVEPGGTSMFVDTFDTKLAEVPESMKVDLPAYQGDGPEHAATFWWPDAEVDYPEPLKVSDVVMKPGSDGGKQVDFTVHNDRKRDFEEVVAMVILRDAQGDLIGGEYMRWDLADTETPSQRLNVPTGDSKHSVDYVFRGGIPTSTDTSNIGINLNNSPAWTDVDEPCSFVFDHRR